MKAEEVKKLREFGHNARIGYAVTPSSWGYARSMEFTGTCVCPRCKRMFLEELQSNSAKPLYLLPNRRKGRGRFSACRYVRSPTGSHS
jgi:hypothetical protein